jgi:aminopeptidase N
MENYGLVAYREIYLLFNEQTSTTRDEENIILTIAHEFAVSQKHLLTFMR